MSTPNVQVGGDVLVKIGAIIVGGQRGATLTRSVSQVSTSSKLKKGWTSGRPSIREWSASCPGLWEASGVDYLGHEANFEVRVGQNFQQLQGRKGLSVAMGLSTIPVISATESADRFLKADRRTVSFSVSGNEIVADPALAALKTAYETSSQVEVKFSIGTTVVSGFGNVMSDGLGADDGAIVSFDFSIEMQDEVTITATGAAAGLDALMNAYKAGTEVSITFDPDAGDGPITGRTRYAGSGLPTSITITADDEAEVNYAIQIDGSGPIVRTEVSA